jgi:hypothetical protein
VFERGARTFRAERHHGNACGGLLSRSRAQRLFVERTHHHRGTGQGHHPLRLLVDAKLARGDLRIGNLLDADDDVHGRPWRVNGEPQTRLHGSLFIAR